MKVTIRRDSPRKADYVAIFGNAPIGVQPTVYTDGESDVCPLPPRGFRVDIGALKILQRQKLAKYIADRYHVPVDQAFAKGIVLAAADVMVVEELFP